MRCPQCSETGTCRRTRRAGLYPVPVALLFTSYAFAFLWTAGRPWMWRCRACGAEFVRHSKLSLAWRILGWLAIGLALFLLLGGLLGLAVLSYLKR